VHQQGQNVAVYPNSNINSLFGGWGVHTLNVTAATWSASRKRSEIQFRAEVYLLCVLACV
jgi:hypothetical protein